MNSQEASLNPCGWAYFVGIVVEAFRMVSVILVYEKAITLVEGRVDLCLFVFLLD